MVKGLQHRTGAFSYGGRYRKAYVAGGEIF